LIQVLDDSKFLQGVIAQIPERPSDVGVVFLFDIGVIVFSGGARAAKFQTLLLTVPEEMAIDKDTVVIGIDPKPAKRTSATDDLKGFEDSSLASAHDRLSLPPARGDLGSGQGIQMLSFGRSPAMKDQVHLNKAHLGGIPVGQLQRDGFVEQGGLPGIAGSIIAPFFLIGFEKPVNGSGADGLKLHGRAPRDPKVTSPYQGIDLGPKQGRQSLATGVIKELPQPQQDAMDLCSITTRPLFRRWPGFKQQGIDLSNGVFSVLSRISAIFVQNLSLCFSRSLGVGL